MLGIVVRGERDSLPYARHRPVWPQSVPPPPQHSAAVPEVCDMKKPPSQRRLPALRLATGRGLQRRRHDEGEDRAGPDLGHVAEAECEGRSDARHPLPVRALEAAHKSSLHLATLTLEPTPHCGAPVRAGLALQLRFDVRVQVALRELSGLPAAMPVEDGRC